MNLSTHVTSDPTVLLPELNLCSSLIACTVMSANDAVVHETKSPLLKG